MRIITALFAAILVFTGCIGWNSEQKDVVDCYNAARDHTENSEWNRLQSSFTDDTENLIDALAEFYSENGAPFENDPALFLEALAMETDLLYFPESILSVEVTGDRALLLADGESEPLAYEFRRESGRWKLNLEPVLSELVQTLLQGTGASFPQTGGADAIPSFISRGNGNCPFLVRNGLTGLAVHNVFCSPSESDSWGEDLLGPSILGTGAELQLNLEPGTYDIQIYDSRESSYTLWQVQLAENGVLWEVTGADLDL